MERLNQPICDKVSPQLSSSKHMFIVLLLVAILSGILGYLIGANTRKNIPGKQLLKQPMPTLLPTFNLPPTTRQISIPVTITRIPDGWKVFTSPENDYTFSYPATSGWEIEPRANSVIDVICSFCSTKTTITDFEVEPRKNMSLNEFIKETSWIPAANFKKTTIDGYEAVEALQLATQNVNWVLYFLSHNGRGYELGYGLKDQQNITKLDQVLPPNPDILSTFKFLN